MTDTKEAPAVALPAPAPDPNEPTAAEKAARANGGGRLFGAKIIKRYHDFRDDMSGVTAIEYGLLASLIAVVIIASVRAVGSQLQITFNAVAATLKAA